MQSLEDLIRQLPDLPQRQAGRKRCSIGMQEIEGSRCSRLGLHHSRALLKGLFILYGKLIAQKHSFPRKIFPLLARFLAGVRR